MSHLKRRRYRGRRPLRTERLEERQVLTSYFFGGGPDDAFVVAKDSSDQALDVLQNDTYAIPSYDYVWYHPSAERPRGVVSVTQPEHGSVQLDLTTGILKLTVEPGFVGVDSFTYTGEVQGGERYEATVSLHIVEPYVAMPDWTRVDEGSPAQSIRVIDNDYQLLGDLQPSITAVAGASLGADVAIAADGQSLIYTPSEGFSGVESLTYTAVDARGNASTATVTIEVVTLDDANDDYFQSEAELEHALLNRLLELRADEFGTLATSYGTDIFYYHTTDVSLVANPIAFDSFGRNLTSVNSSTFLNSATTNVQVAGVDEADIVKTDGRYLYVVSNNLGAGDSLHELIIIDVQDAANPEVIQRVSFAESIRELFLLGDRLTVITSPVPQLPAMNGLIPFRSLYGTPMAVNEAFTASVLDVSDPSEPVVSQRIEMTGSYEQARIIGEFVYLVSRFSATADLTLQTVCDEEAEPCFFETAVQFRDRFIEEGLIEEVVPVSISQQADGTEKETMLVPINSIAKSTIENAASTGSLAQSMIVSTIDVTADFGDFVDTEVRAGGGATDVYVNTESIYLMGTDWGRTEITKLAIDPLHGQVEFAATGSVEGSILNRFSVDEYHGNLRVATTGGSGWMSGQVNVTVLTQDGSQLIHTGSVEDIAPGERIYATRFFGDRGFVVTFRKVDPFFVMDLSDPNEPVVLGELKVPGYSQYLQVLDENHVLGIGRSADEQTGLYQSLQISIFEVTDAAAPSLVDRYEFLGGRSTWSPLATNAWELDDPHAVT
ncbi:MAG: beta-propeller domain-containing protein, partial [Planctomycetales bacterium]|nr:beta-propeller domain-containing protein [Planctomycetales bacterium]